MPDFKPGDVVHFQRPENWVYTGGKHGYLWVVERVHPDVSVIDARSVATGRMVSFDYGVVEAADA
jgi:hypothetical protein